MYRQFFQLAQPPFRQEPDPQFLFQHPDWETLSQSLLAAIQQGPPLVKLTGAEGVGKTFLCRYISDQLPRTHEVIHIDNPVGAFDDLVRIICLGLGTNLADKKDPIDPVEELFHLLKTSKNRDRKTVLIIDEAEKTFLATLERLIRFSCENEQDLALTLLLSGRPELQASLKQLSVFYSKVNTGPEYTLLPLTEEQTSEYLRFRINTAGPDREASDDLFTEAAAARIYQLSQGNLGRINSLAEKALQAAYAQQSSHVQASHVLYPSVHRRRTIRPLAMILQLIPRYKHVAAAVAGLILLVVLVSLLTTSDNDETTSPETVSNQQITVAPMTVTQPMEEDRDRPADDSDRSAPDSRSGQETAVAEVAATKEPPEIADTPPRDGKALFEERLRASAGWVAGAYRGESTIYLQRVSSDQVEAEIIALLVEDVYYQARDQLYLLRHNTLPPSIHVFYGRYATMDAAREARNSLPAPLRKEQPYPLAISEALELPRN